MRIPPPGRRLLIAGMAVAGLVGVLVLGLTFTPPAKLVRRLASSNAQWLLSNFMETPTGTTAYTRNGVRKLVAMYVQYGLAAEFRRRHPLPAAGTDAERIFAQLLPLRQVLLNQTEVPHAPEQWAPLLSGVGFCDQLNAMAATILGAEFKHAQIVALADPATAAEHTIGRVWSERERTWLYFDIWGPVTVFRLDSVGKTSVIATHDPFPGAVDDETIASLSHIYQFSGRGHVLNEYPSRYSSFLAYRFGWALHQKTLDSFAPIYAATPIGSKAGAPKPSPSGPQVRQLFADGQLARLFGDSADALARFERIAAIDSTSVLGRAAVRAVARMRGGI